jgi:hypothetical protein
MFLRRLSSANTCWRLLNPEQVFIRFQNVAVISVADPHHFDTDSDFNFDMDPDLTFSVDSYPDLTI